MIREHRVDWSFQGGPVLRDDGWTLIQSGRRTQRDRARAARPQKLPPQRARAASPSPEKPTPTTATTSTTSTTTATTTTARQTLAQNTSTAARRKSYSEVVTDAKSPVGAGLSANQSIPSPHSIWTQLDNTTSGFFSSASLYNPDFTPESHQLFSPNENLYGTSMSNLESFAFVIFERSLNEVLVECKLQRSSDLQPKVKALLQDALATLDEIEKSSLPCSLSASVRNHLWNSTSSLGLNEFDSDGSLPTAFDKIVLLSKTQHYGFNSQADSSDENLPVWDRSVPLSTRLPLTYPSNELPLRLLSPFSRKSVTIDALELKQLKARRLRESFLQDRTIKLKHKAGKILTVRLNQQEQTNQLKESIKGKQAKAEKQRDLFIKGIQEKAKEEKQKSEEIALISALNFENKKIEVAQRHLDSEARLQELEEERLRKLAEVAALQEAAIERRRLQEVERQTKLLREEERRKEMEARRELERQECIAFKEAARLAKCQRITQLKIMKENEINAMRQELSKNFQNKLEKWTTRYTEFLQKKKERAAQANLNAKAVAANAKRTIPSSESINNLLLVSMDDGLLMSSMIDHIDADYCLVAERRPSRGQAVQRRIKKLKKRLREASLNYSFIPSSACLPALSHSMQSVILKLQKLLGGGNLAENGASLDTSLKAMIGELGASDLSVLESFCNNGGVANLFNVLVLLDDDGNLILPTRTLQMIVKVLCLLCQSGVNKEYLMLSMDVCIEELAELTARVLSMQDYSNIDWLHLSSGLLELLLSLFTYLPDDSSILRKAKIDFLSYVLSIDLVGFMCRLFAIVCGPVTNFEDPLFSILLNSFNFIDVTIRIQKLDGSLSSLVHDVFLQADTASILTMLVSLVLHNGLTSRTAALEPSSLQTLVISMTGLRILNSLCSLDLLTMQTLLASDGLQPQFFHLLVFWLCYFLQWNTSSPHHQPHDQLCSKLLHELLILLGNSCIGNQANQSLLRFGQGFILFKMVLALPFEYFCDSELQAVLFPTLIAACAGCPLNLSALKEELDVDVLMDWWNKEKMNCGALQKLGFCFPGGFWSKAGL
ncbi:hypothetical protein BDR26DRAFT_1010535 [Obelidium mucronatum]|nr:hypothetical protein BDR26DRAFT_1010535 [Obelidium mucronatum]